MLVWGASIQELVVRAYYLYEAPKLERPANCGFGISALGVGHAGTRVDREYVRAIEMRSQGQGMLVVATGVASGRRVA